MYNVRMAQNIAERVELIKRGKLLEYFTIGWNVLEAFVAITSGIVAGSIALIGFGIDSLIESLSGSILLWRLADDSDEREKLAVRLVGGSFIILAAYVAFDAVKSLIYKEAPETSYVGIGLAVVSILINAAPGPCEKRCRRKTGKPRNGVRLQANQHLRLPVRDLACRLDLKCLVRLVVG